MRTKTLYVFSGIFIFFSLGMTKCNFPVNEVGRKSFVFYLNDKKVVPSVLQTSLWYLNDTVSGQDTLKMEVLFNYNDPRYYMLRFTFKIFPFTGPGTYRVNGGDIKAELYGAVPGGTTFEPVSEADPGASYLRILEGTPEDNNLRGIFEAKFTDNAGKQYDITKGRFDYPVHDYH